MDEDTQAPYPTWEEALDALQAAQPACGCGCPATDHTLRATDEGTPVWLCLGCLHACPGLPRQDACAAASHHHDGG
jgi:hypothetical protein